MRAEFCHTVNVIDSNQKRLTKKGIVFLVGGALATIIWAVTLYWSLVANRVLDGPWVI